MATLNDVISCYNELVDEVNGHTASIDKLNARIEDATLSITANVSAIQTVSTAMASLTAKLEARLAQVEARLDELVQEHDVMMDTISSLLAAPTVEEASTVELKRVGKKPTVVEEKKGEEETVSPAVPTETLATLKRVGKRAVEEAPTVVEETPTVEEEQLAPTPAPEPTVPAPAPTEAIAALKRASASAPKPKTTVTEIQKRAFARQYMVEHGAKVEDLRNPEKINETIASEEFTAWMNAR